MKLQQSAPLSRKMQPRCHHHHLLLFFITKSLDDTFHIVSTFLARNERTGRFEKNHIKIMRRSPSLSASPAALRRQRLLKNEGNQNGDLKHVSSVDGGYHPMIRKYSDVGYPTEGSRLLKPLDKQLPGDVTKPSSLFAPSDNPVGLSHWIVPALLCALAYALYNIFIKKGSATIHPILGGVILQFVAAFIGLVLLLFLTFGPPQEEMFYDNNGIYYAVLAGFSVGAAEIISFSVSGMGVPATQSIPIIIGGSVFFGTVLGKIFLGEDLSCAGWMGVLLIAVGITLVATDPNANLGH